MRHLFFVGLVAASLGLSGCGGGETPQVQTYEAPQADPLTEAKAILNNYAGGMPVTSEAESFSDLAARVKEKDPTKGEVLEKGLAEIKANPSTAQTKAKELLKKL
jgi:hypothetical protein